MLDVIDIYCMSWYMCNYWILELICAKDSNIAHSVTHDIKTCAQWEINTPW